MRPVRHRKIVEADFLQSNTKLEFDIFRGGLRSKGLKPVAHGGVDISVFFELAEEGPVGLAPEDVSPHLRRPVVVDPVADIGTEVKIFFGGRVISEEGKL